MKERLQTLLSSEKIASSRFADIIGVNRSSISHLLSGRNNPSLDFLQRVLKKFPQISPDWLLLGQGNMYRNSGRINEVKAPLNLFAEEIKHENNIVQSEPPILYSKDKLVEVIPTTDSTDLEKTSAPDNDSLNHKEVKNKKAEIDKEVEKIIFFYTDKSFDVYYPGDNSGE